MKNLFTREYFGAAFYKDSVDPAAIHTQAHAKRVSTLYFPLFTNGSRKVLGRM